MLLERAYQKAVLNEEITTDKEINNIHIDRFIHLVGAHLKEQHSVQFYADKLCITPNYLNEIITSVMGLSAKRYIQNQVIDEAKKLLAYTDVPISDIAFELHFSTVSYFIRCFRQHTGKHLYSSVRSINREKYYFFLSFYCTGSTQYPYFCIINNQLNCKR